MQMITVIIMVLEPSLAVRATVSAGRGSEMFIHVYIYIYIYNETYRLLYILQIPIHPYHYLDESNNTAVLNAADERPSEWPFLWGEAPKCSKRGRDGEGVRLREGGRKLEKVGEGERKWEKVNESGRRCEKVRETERRCEKVRETERK